MVICNCHLFCLNGILFSFSFPSFTSSMFCTTTRIFCTVTRLTIRLIVLRPLNKLRQLDSTRALSSPRTLTQPVTELTCSQLIIQPAQKPKGTKGYLVCCHFPFIFHLIFAFLFLFFTFLLRS